VSLRTTTLNAKFEGQYYKNKFTSTPTSARICFFANETPNFIKVGGMKLSILDSIPCSFQAKEEAKQNLETF
jgi:hypothetical protein